MVSIQNSVNSRPAPASGASKPFSLSAYHSSPEMLAGLREGRLHAALMMQPSKQAGRGVAFVQLKNYPVGVAVAAGHPFARRRRVTPELVCREPIVAYSRKDYPDYHEFIARRLGPRARQLEIVEECDSGTSLGAAVASGRGVCICASILATSAPRRLIFVPLDPSPAPAVVGIAHRNEGSSSLTGALVEIARAAFRPGDGPEASRRS